MDTTRADALSCYGAPAGITPNLDGLAAEGVRYAAARTVMPLTMPAHASIHTGLYPPRHTVRTNSQAALPASAQTLAEAAAAAGLDTAAFVAAAVLADDFGLDQGFARYDQVERPEVQTGIHYDYRDAKDVADGAISWLGVRDEDAPFFLWVHFFDPHLPLAPPKAFLDQAQGDPYRGEVARMDHAIGRILNKLRERGVYDETLVIAVADHGEAQEDHGESTHGVLVYDAVLRVPLIVRDPGGERAGERSDEIASVADVYPTISEALELDANTDVDGRSLFRRRVPADRGAYFENLHCLYSFGFSHVAGWVDQSGKYIYCSTPEFYELEADPGETYNAIAQNTEAVEHGRERIRALGRRSTLVRSEEDRAAAELADQLRRLGYTGVDGDGQDFDLLAPTTAPSPAAMIQSHRDYLRAAALQQAGRGPEAIPILEGIVNDNPRHHLAWTQLSTAYVKSERFEEAIVAAKRALAAGTDWYGPHENLGVAYDNLQRFEEAVEEYKRVLTFKPGHTAIRERLVLVLQHLERDDEAAEFAAGG